MPLIILFFELVVESDSQSKAQRTKYLWRLGDYKRFVMSSRTERACMVCGIIQPFRDFVSHGCPNCESLLPFKGDDSVVVDCTSPSFEGFVALCDQESSWVAKWLRIDGFQTGMYAVKVNGRLPEDVVRALTDKGIVYRPRDGSVQD